MLTKLRLNFRKVLHSYFIILNRTPARLSFLKTKIQVLLKIKRREKWKRGEEEVVWRKREERRRRREERERRRGERGDRRRRVTASSGTAAGLSYTGSKDEAGKTQKRNTG